MSISTQIDALEQHLVQLNPYRALRLLNTLITNRTNSYEFAEANKLVALQSRIQTSVDEFLSGYKER